MDYLPYLVAGIALFFLVLQLAPVVRARRMRGRAVSGLAELLPEPQSGGGRQLIYFWSPRCPLCRGMTPLIDALMGERDDVHKVNVAESVDLARELGVMATPTVVLLRGSRVEKMLVGAKSEEQIRALLD